MEARQTKPEENIPVKERTIYDSTFFKFITVGIYLAGVSGLGFCLSIYHIFIWDSKMPPVPEIHHAHHPPHNIG